MEEDIQNYSWKKTFKTIHQLSNVSWETLSLKESKNINVLRKKYIYVEREARLKKSRVLWVTMFKTIKIYSKNYKIVKFSSYFIGFILEFKIFN